MLIPLNTLLWSLHRLIIPNPPTPVCSNAFYVDIWNCNNVNQVWSDGYKILVFLKYHIHPWANFFDINIFRRINTYIKVVHLAFFRTVMLLKISVSKILVSLVLQNYQNFTEMYPVHLLGTTNTNLVHLLRIFVYLNFELF